MGVEKFWKIAIVVPVDDGQTEVPLLPSDAVTASSSLGELIDYIKSSDPIGRTGNYIGVYGLNIRSGGYTPAAGATPVKGQHGRDEEGLCYELITYAAKTVTDKEIESFCNEVADRHPWEHPTIEIEEIHSWVPE